jgi:MFS family permease
VLVQALSWRWVFFVNVPIGAAVLALAPRIVPESRSESAAKGGYDLEGAVTITLGTLALVFTLIKADSWGWTSGRTIAGFVVSAVLIVAFLVLVIERRHKDPLVPLRIFSNRSLSAADATLLVVVAALFGMFFFLTLYLQQCSASAR